MSIWFVISFSVIIAVSLFAFMLIFKGGDDE